MLRKTCMADENDQEVLVATPNRSGVSHLLNENKLTCRGCLTRVHNSVAYMLVHVLTLTGSGVALGSAFTQKPVFQLAFAGAASLLLLLDILWKALISDIPYFGLWRNRFDLVLVAACGFALLATVVLAAEFAAPMRMGVSLLVTVRALLGLVAATVACIGSKRNDSTVIDLNEMSEVHDRSQARVNPSGILIFRSGYSEVQHQEDPENQEEERLN